ncbi:MAG TPA: putative metal-dependent hydrolase [Bryobacteraceae bacterium]|nr:putative metal-dependent hydrolase [Bryobacteraceae bacterium]
MDLEALQYPIGRFRWDSANGSEHRGEWLRAIERTPGEVRRVVAGLTDEQLDTPYRPDGWTVRQVVHHYADDHLNSYCRFKLALTEDAPAIKPYSEPLWAELPDARKGPIEPSLELLAALHQRWMAAWRALAEPDWLRTFVHPKRGPVTLHQLAALYAWHGRHHVAQVRALRVRSGWREEA